MPKYVIRSVVNIIFRHLHACYKVSENVGLCIKMTAIPTVNMYCNATLLAKPISYCTAEGLHFSHTLIDLKSTVVSKKLEKQLCMFVVSEILGFNET